jgi:GT2 family glycosyltransferase
VVPREENRGRARAREDGWRAARGELIAFTDDDCEPDPRWLELGLRACAQNPGAIVQGRTDPKRDEQEAVGPFGRPFTRSIAVTRLDAGFQTCNIFYPRDLLERIDGFDVAAFGRVHGGEDADLAWRAIATGARPVFARDARVYHAVTRLGPIGKLRLAAGWEMKAYARHDGLRRAHFFRRIFWKGSHYLLLRALLAKLLPRRWRLMRAWLAAPYAVHLAERGRVEGGGLLLAPYFVLHDLIEICAVARAGIRYRTPML